jgi:hypothetical protein
MTAASWASSTRTYFAATGATGSLLAAAVIAFVFLVAVVAYNSWPSGAFGGRGESVSVSAGGTAAAAATAAAGAARALGAVAATPAAGVAPGGGPGVAGTPGRPGAPRSPVAPRGTGPGGGSAPGPSDPLTADVTSTLRQGTGDAGTTEGEASDLSPNGINNTLGNVKTALDHAVGNTSRTVNDAVAGVGSTLGGGN